MSAPLETIQAAIIAKTASIETAIEEAELFGEDLTKRNITDLMVRVFFLRLLNY